jgi:hypothetical protein
MTRSRTVRVTSTSPGAAIALTRARCDASVPSALTPQLWFLPAATEVKLPAGGLAWPELLSPQQATIPFVLSAQVCEPPAEIIVNA